MNENYEIPAPLYEIGQTVQRTDGRVFTIQNRVWSDVMKQWFYTESGKPFSKFDHREKDIYTVVPAKTRTEIKAENILLLLRGKIFSGEYTYQPEHNRVVYSAPRGEGAIYLSGGFQMNHGGFSLSAETMKLHIQILEELSR